MAQSKNPPLTTSRLFAAEDDSHAESIVTVMIDAMAIIAGPGVFNGGSRRRTGVQLPSDGPAFMVVLALDLPELRLQPVQLGRRLGVLVHPPLPLGYLMGDAPNLLGGSLEGPGQLPLFGAEQLLQPVFCGLHPFDVGLGVAAGVTVDAPWPVLVLRCQFVLEGVMPGKGQFAGGSAQLSA